MFVTFYNLGETLIEAPANARTTVSQKPDKRKPSFPKNFVCTLVHADVYGTTFIALCCTIGLEGLEKSRRLVKQRTATLHVEQHDEQTTISPR